MTPVLTKGGEHFVTAMSLGTLAESQVHSSLWELKDEVEIGHIQLSRAADFVLVCPATADLLARMAAGIADDLATTLLLATDKPVVVAPAMNVRMWRHAATQRNIAQLKSDGVRVIDPAEGEMACGELARAACRSRRTFGPALRLAEVTLAGRHILVTAGPTHEPIDPVRVIANRSSGRQGFAIAAAAADAGARVTLIAGPVALDTPGGVDRIDVETAGQMADAVIDVTSGGRRRPRRCGRRLAGRASPAKLKKSDGPPKLEFVPTRDILAELGARPDRPRLIIGFAAETERVVETRGRQARGEEGRLDRRQRRLRRRDGRNPQPRASGHRRGDRGLARSHQGGCRAPPGRPDRRGDRMIEIKLTACPMAPACRSPNMPASMPPASMFARPRS